MKINELNLPSIIQIPEQDPYSLAIVSLLKASKLYKRGVAFFHSEWIDLAKEGLLEFVNNGGKIQLLTSINVDEDEFNAFKTGQSAKTDEILRKKIFEQAVNSVPAGKEWTLNYLSWLICENIMEIRLSIHKSNIKSMYHDKISLFYDGETIASIFGTMNDSITGLKNEETLIINSEKNNTFQFVKGFEKIFDDRWNGQTRDYITVALPDVVKFEFNRLKSDFNPYNLTIKDRTLHKKTPLDYQLEPIKKLENNGFRGVLCMATGTGKTLTSLFTVDRIIELYGKAVICVVVPQTTLISQWENEINNQFSFPKIIKCAFAKTQWLSELIRNSVLLRNNDSNFFIITTYKTLISNEFMNASKRFKHNFVYIFDECHRLGGPEIINRFQPLNNSFRIGLSATPERWFDETGTNYLKTCIGKTVYEYSMEKAIKTHRLCEYRYYIHLCELSDEETQKFINLTNKISRLSTINKGEDFKENKSLELALNARARISKTCESKWEAFFSDFDKYPDKRGIIVYVYDEQVDEMISELKKRFNITAYGIVAETPSERRKDILKSFASGHIPVLVAIQCLDEGVDMPDCHAEFILASSTNPREFIQRRGRVLRLNKFDPNKIADIYDYVTIAKGRNNNLYSKQDKQAVIKRELPRVAEFVNLSKNKDDLELSKYLVDIDGTELYSKECPWANNINEIGEKENE